VTGRAGYSIDGLGGALLAPRRDMPQWSQLTLQLIGPNRQTANALAGGGEEGIA